MHRTLSFVGLVCLLSAAHASPGAATTVALQSPRFTVPPAAANQGELIGTNFRAIHLKDSQGQISLFLTLRVSPGDELVFTHETEPLYKTQTYLSYDFDGIVGDSARLTRTGAMQMPDETDARSDGSFDHVLFLERAEDGAFYFAPKGAERFGVIAIKRDPSAPAFYLAAFVSNAP
jgi:hypothetical protein